MQLRYAAALRERRGVTNVGGRAEPAGPQPISCAAPFYFCVAGACNAPFRNAAPDRRNPGERQDAGELAARVFPHLAAAVGGLDHELGALADDLRDQPRL